MGWTMENCRWRARMTNCRLWVRAMVGERQEAACWAQKRLHVCFVVVWWGQGVILRI